MFSIKTLGIVALLVGLSSCSNTIENPPANQTALAHDGAATQVSTWKAGDTIFCDKVPDIKILKVHKNGSGPVCGMGRHAKLKYVAMLANGKVIDPGRRPFSFAVGKGRAIAGWDVVVAQMRVGDSITITMPEQLAYGPSKGDLKFDIELLSFE